jgi:creatinine amidohydrolase
MLTQPARKFMWDDMRIPEIQAAALANGLVIIPIASIEQHGPHLPTKTDTGAILDIAIRAANAIVDFPVLVMPPVCWGISPFHAVFPGTINISSRTFGSLISEICESIHSHGFRKIFLLNGHGVNSGVLRTLVYELTAKGIGVSMGTYYEMIPKEVWASVLEVDDRIVHAGEIETSLMLRLYPELVEQGMIDDSLGAEGKEYLARRRFQGVVIGPNLRIELPTGTMGIAAAGSAAKGEQVLAAAAKAVVAFLQAMGEVVPDYSTARNG